jgi:hypothetical protein
MIITVIDLSLLANIQIFLGKIVMIIQFTLMPPDGLSVENKI